MDAEQPDGASTAPDVRLQLMHGPDGPGVLADGRALPVPSHSSATEVGLAAARRHAARSGRDLRVEVVDGAAVTLVAVSPHGTVTLLEAPPTQPLPRVVPDEPVTAVDRTTVHIVPPPVPVPTVSAWVSPPAPTRPRRPVSSLVIASLVAVAVLVGAVGTGVATLSSAQALPDSCRPVTIYAVDGQGGSSDVLRGVTDPLAQQFGEKVSVVTVPAPPAGGSFASAESDAVSSLAKNVGDHVDGCPTGSLMLFGYSQGAQVAGDLASRVGTGLEPRIPAGLVQAVGLFGDPARSPRTRAVPDGTAGQGALPPRAVGFGSLDARTIEICAPGDPVCDSPANAASPPLEQAVGSPVHGSYRQLPVATGTTAPQWAASSLGKVVAAIPTTAGPAPSGAGTAPQSGPVTTTTPGAASGDGSAVPGTGSTDADTPTTGADTGSAGADPTGARSTGPGSRGSTGASASTSAPTGESADPGYGGSSGAGGSSEQGGVAGGAAATTTARSGSAGSTAATGTGAGAGASTERSGSASSTTTSEERTGSSASGAGRSDTAGTGSSGTVSSGQGSTRVSTTSAPDASAGTGTSSDNGGYGSSGGSASTRSRSSGGGADTSAPAETRARSGSGSGSASRSEEPTSRGTSSRGRGAGGSSSGSATTSTTTTSSKGGGSGGTKTDAAWSLVKGLTGFKSTPWNNENATDPSSAPSPNVPGRQAVEFDMPGGGKRTEAEPDVPEFREGQTAFVGYSGLLDQGFPTTTDTWQVIMQFKQPGTGSPPLAVEVGKGQLRLANNGRNEKDFCPVTPGQPFSFRLGVTFGGAVDAWCNGRQTLSGYRTPEPNVKGSAYLKTGIYRDESIKQDSKLFVNDLKVGKTLESVSGLAGADGTGTAGPTNAG